MSTVKVNGDLWETGCYLAGHRGHYIGQAAIQVAVSLGWDDPDAPRAADEYDEHNSDPEWEFFDSWYDLVDDATEYLRSITEGGSWEWIDGELFIMDDAEMDEYYGQD